MLYLHQLMYGYLSINSNTVNRRKRIEPIRHLSLEQQVVWLSRFVALIMDEMGLLDNLLNIFQDYIGKCFQHATWVALCIRVSDKLEFWSSFWYPYLISAVSHPARWVFNGDEHINHFLTDENVIVLHFTHPLRD